MVTTYGHHLLTKLINTTYQHNLSTPFINTTYEHLWTFMNIFELKWIVIDAYGHLFTPSYSKVIKFYSVN